MKSLLQSFFRRTTPILALALMAGSAQAQITQDRSVVPAAIRDAILLEYSGELAYSHVQILALNRQRAVEEYAETYMETRTLRQCTGSVPRLGLLKLPDSDRVPTPLATPRIEVLLFVLYLGAFGTLSCMQEKF